MDTEPVPLLPLKCPPLVAAEWRSCCLRALSVRNSHTVPDHSSAAVEHAGDDGNVTTEDANVDAVVASPTTREKHLLEEHNSHCIHRVAAYTSAEIIVSPVVGVEGAAGGAAAASSDAVVPEFEEAAGEALGTTLIPSKRKCHNFLMKTNCA